MFNPDQPTRSTFKLAREVLDQVKVLELVDGDLARIINGLQDPARRMECERELGALRVRLHPVRDRLRWASNQYASLLQR